VSVPPDPKTTKKSFAKNRSAHRPCRNDLSKDWDMAMTGYARSSCREERQVLDHHIEALTAAGCERVFDDDGSSTGAQRPGLAACLDAVRRGDVLVVAQLHHLGRRVEELIDFVDELKGRGVGFRALDTLFDTTTPTGDAFLQIHAEFAEMERNVIRQRISEGLAAARARGRNGGRPRLMTPERLRHAQQLMADQAGSISSICRDLGDIPTSTLYHYLHPDGSLKEPGRKLLATEHLVSDTAFSAGSPELDFGHFRVGRRWLS
jgi:DNA invertase Pin-like site-specific DNA recombinase